jgi:4-diphosphocytidyl-2-C-methyl-D-erythritol kinase
VLSALRAAAGVRLARMSGSGATCFAIFDNDAAAQRAALSIRLDHPLWWVHAGTLG